MGHDDGMRRTGELRVNTMFSPRCACIKDTPSRSKKDRDLPQVGEISHEVFDDSRRSRCGPRILDRTNSQSGRSGIAGANITSSGRIPSQRREGRLAARAAPSSSSPLASATPMVLRASLSAT